MRETDVEKKLVESIEETGGLCIKFGGIFQVGLPDRICLLPQGNIIFVELKAPGKKPRRIQAFMHNKLRQLGFDTRVIDSPKQIEDMLIEYGYGYWFKQSKKSL